MNGRVSRDLVALMGAVDNLERCLIDIGDEHTSDSLFSVQVVRSMARRLMDCISNQACLPSVIRTGEVRHKVARKRWSSLVSSELDNASRVRSYSALLKWYILSASISRERGGGQNGQNGKGGGKATTSTQTGADRSSDRMSKDGGIFDDSDSDVTSKGEAERSGSTAVVSLVHSKKKKKKKTKPKVPCETSDKSERFELDITIERARVKRLEEELEAMRLDLRSAAPVCPPVAAWFEQSSDCMPIFNKSTTNVKEELEIVMKAQKDARDAGILLTEFGAFFFTSSVDTIKLHVATYTEKTCGGEIAITKGVPAEISVTDAKCIAALYGSDDRSCKIRNSIALQLLRMVKLAVIPKQTNDTDRSSISHTARYSALGLAGAVFRACATFHSASFQREVYMKHWGRLVMSIHWPLECVGV